MASYLLASLLTLVAVLVLFNAYCLLKNFLQASKIGLPVIVSSISPDNPIWLALQTVFEKLFSYLPLHVTSFTRYTQLGWEVHDRFHPYQRLGDAWILVTPARNWLFVANPQAVTDIHNRGRDFIRPAWMLEMLSVFGPNISVAEGQDWQRQRKLTSTPFNENKSPLVWSEATRQTKQMMAFWRSLGPKGSVHTSHDVRSLALNVLAYVAFQKSYPFKGYGDEDRSDQRSVMTYRDSLSTILDNALLVLVVPQSLFSLSFLPKSWRHIGDAISYFRSYMQEQIRDERESIRAGQPGSGTLVSNLVRAGENKPSKDATIDEMKTNYRPLTEAEILGNIFVYNFAGHDTTAISFAYALFYLVAYPEVQEWVHEEIVYYTNMETEQDGHLDYKLHYPKLKRCLAVLLETLRLYNPLTATIKYTGKKATLLSVNDRTYQVPPDTVVIPSLPGSHTHPRHWSSDSLEWRPQRWIVNATASKTHGFEQEVLFNPEKGVYFPWSEGARNCPGKKFAQVEFVAVIATLLRSMVGRPVPKSGQTLEQAQKLILDIIQDSGIRLLLQMKNPEAVSIRWTDRE